jgi:ankyrin repeat protein
MRTTYFERKEIEEHIHAGRMDALMACVEHAKQRGKYHIFGFDRVFNTAMHSKHWQAPLFSAVAHGRKEMVSYLIEQGCKVDLLDKDGRSLLHLAFAEKKFELAEMLISMGADFKARTTTKERVFDAALASGNATWCEWFQQQGETLDYVDEAGNTTLHQACKGGNLSLIDQVVSNTDFSFDQPNRQGIRALDRCREMKTLEYVLSKNPNLPLDVEFSSGRRSVHRHAQRGSLDIVCHLLDQGVDSKLIDKNKTTLMHYAVDSGNHALVGELIRRQVSVEGRTRINYRPLHWAVVNNDFAMVKILVECGKAKVNIKGNQTFIVLETRTPLYLAVEAGYHDIARYLVEHGADVNALADTSNNTAAVAAAARGEVEMLRFLLERGASANGVNRNTSPGCTDFYAFPLARAANAEVVNLLVDFGADVNACPRGVSWRDSALRQIIDRVEEDKSPRAQGYLSAIQALLQHGAALQDSGYGGDVVTSCKCPAVAKLLNAERVRRNSQPLHVSDQVATPR